MDVLSITNDIARVTVWQRRKCNCYRSIFLAPKAKTRKYETILLKYYMLKMQMINILSPIIESIKT